MTQEPDQAAGWRKFGWDVSTNTVSNLIAAGVLAVAVAAVSLLRPVQAWLSGKVYLYGWGVVLVVVTVMATGYLLGRRRSKAPREEGAFSVGAYPREPIVFQPDRLQTSLIELMRYADGRWTDRDQVARLLTVSSRQDLDLALSQLEVEGWIEGHDDNYLMKEGNHMFRLAGLGIGFAKGKGYPTQTEFERAHKD